MSKKNTLLDCSELTPTATVVIFDKKMKRILLVFNERLMAFVPPGGKQIPKDKGDIVHTAFREIKEELGIKLKTVSGNWMNKKGKKVRKPTVIQEEDFELIGEKYCDFLFFFRLTGDYPEIFEAEKIGEWYRRETVKNPSVKIEGKAFQMLVPGIRKVILDLLR